MRLYILFFLTLSVNSQNIDVNNSFYYEQISNSILQGNLETNYSLNIKPILSNDLLEFPKQFNTLISNEKKTLLIKSLGVDYFLEYNAHHPYNRNNGSMIPNRGYQHIVSPGLYFKVGPLSIKFKPEHHYSENKKFDGFWDGRYPEIWAERYKLWNHIDMPERFGDKRHNRTTIGQSNIRLNWKNISIGISNENIWWGPAKRNSIMMSNHAEGFKHISFQTNKPVNTPIGNFEWQIITGKLESSGYTPPNTEFEYALIYDENLQRYHSYLH
mgnify:CR=1 FL=1